MTTRNEMRKMDDEEFRSFCASNSFNHRTMLEAQDLFDEITERFHRRFIILEDTVTALTNKIGKLEDRINTL